MFASGKSYAQIAEAKGNKIVTARNSIYRIQDNWESIRNRRWWSGP